MRVCGLALLACLAAGCAAHRSPDLSGVILQRSDSASAKGATFDAPGMNGAPQPAGDSSGAGPQTAIDPRLREPPRPKTSTLPTLETTNAGLGAALAALAALKGHPTADAYVAVGDAYHRLGVFDQAEENYRLALRLKARSAAASEGLARVWRDWGWPQIGLPYAYRALSAAPRSPSVENTLGTLLFILGDPDAARIHFQRAVTLDPTAAYALNNLCYVAFILGEEGSAISRCDEALALAPEATSTRNNLALAYAAEGHTDQAADEFARGGDRPAANFNLGMVHLARHEYRDAAELFQAACRATPEVAGACAWAAQARRLAAATPSADIK